MITSIFYLKRVLLITSLVLVNSLSWCVASNTNLTSPDSLKNYILYLHENPIRFIEHGQIALQQANNRNDKTEAAIVYSLLSNANLNLGNIKDATHYIDSAELAINQTSDKPILLEFNTAKADLLFQQNKIKEAYVFIAQAIKSAKKRGDTKLEIEHLLYQGNQYKKQGLLEQAIDSQKDALKLAEKNSYVKLAGKCYRNIGSAYFQHSQFNDALDWYGKALDIAHQQSDSLELINILKNISLVNRDLGKIDDASSNLNMALQIAHKLSNREQMADIYNLMGSLAVRGGKTSEALAYYQQSLIIREQLDLQTSIASTLENISRVQRELNQFEDASNNLLRAIAIRKNLNDLPRLGSAYNDMGTLFAQQNELSDALMYYLNSLKIRQEVANETDIARSLNNIGLTYRRMRSHKNALKYFEQALELISEKNDPLAKSYAYTHQGNTLRDIGLPEQALKSYQKALELRKITGNQLIISQSMKSVAIAYSDLEEYSNSRNFLNQSLTILKKFNDEVGIADIYNELGNVSVREEKYTEALQHFQLAANLFGNNFDLEKRGLCIRKVGEIQTILGDYKHAIENLQLANSLAVKTKSDKLLELTLLALHDYYIARGQHQEALSYYYQHIALRDSLNAITQKETVWQASLDLELDKKAEEIKMIEGEVEGLRTEAKLKSVELKQQKMIKNFFAVVSFFVLFIAIGSVYGYVIIRQKNNWLNQANEKLARSEQDLKVLVQTKDKLFSIIAHDLRSPFTALLGLTDVLSKQAPQLNPSEVSEYGSLIHESSEKLLNLIDNLLQWSRSQTGKIKLIPKEIPLNTICSEVINVLEIQANAKDVKLVNGIADDLVVYADYDAVSTVFRNLISNAIKYSTKEGVVKLDASKVGKNIQISVADTGVGISQENIKKLFKIEENFSTKGTNMESGTGLGLILCKEFIERNGGEIYVNSVLDNGTTFSFTLPAKQNNTSV